jgi:hypothetical protein
MSLVPNFSISGVKRPFRVKNFISSGEFSHIGAVSGINYYGNKSSFNILGFQATNNSFGQQAITNDFGALASLNVFSFNTTQSYFGYTGVHNIFGDSSVYNQFGCFSTSGIFGLDSAFNSFGERGAFNTFGQSGKINTFGNVGSGNEFGCTNGVVNTVNYFGDGANNIYYSGIVSGNIKITKDLIVENKIYRSNKPVWSLFRTGNVAGLTNGTFTHVPLTGSISGFNTSGFTQSNGSGYWVCPYKGFFNIIGNCVVGNLANTIGYHSIFINGLETSTSSATYTTLAIVVSNRICLLNSGDIVDMRLGPHATNNTNNGNDFTLQIFLIEPL